MTSISTETTAVYWDEKLRGAEPPGIVSFGPPGARCEEVAAPLGPAARASLPTRIELVAAALALVSRYGSNSDAVIVTTAAGAPLVVRVAIDETTTFAGLVAHCAAEHDEVQAHQDTAPAAEELERAGLLEAGIICEREPALPAWCGRVPLLLLVDAARVRVRYDRAAYPTWFADQFAAHYARTLDILLRGPAAGVTSYELIDPSEQTRLIADGNPPPIAVTSEDDLVTRFEARAAASPSSIALSCEERRLTYAQLDALSSTVAAALIARGIGEGDLVAMLLDRSEWVVIAILGILKSGAAYLPIDPSYPFARIEHMLADSRAKLLLSERRFLGEHPDAVDVHALAEGAWSPRGRAARSIDRLAYVIYTSGSTGVPKGVLITHRNVARLFEATDQRYRFGAGDVWLLFHSPAFDFSVWEMCGALLYGGRLVVPTHVVSRDARALRALAARERVTVLNQTPSAFRQFDTADAGEAASGAELALRWVIFAGEMLDPSSLAGWLGRHGDQTPRMVNMYGITETTVHVTWRQIVRDDLTARSVIGVPMDGWRIYLLDRYGNLVPEGVAGEIYVGGDGVARGYLNRAELTAQRFLDDRFARDGSTMYRSGDLARRLPGGDLEYLGRIDQQVKVRGFRIEVGEIEQRLLDHPAVDDAAILPVQGEDGVELVAFLFGSAPPAARDLRNFLRRSLPPYMVPSRFIPIAARPLTSNGKLDRRALLSRIEESAP